MDDERYVVWLQTLLDGEIPDDDGGDIDADLALALSMLNATT